MRLLIISQHYWPESYGAGVIVEELAGKLHQLGHQVTVLTGMPNYPDGKIPPQYRGHLKLHEDHHGVHIIRTWFLPASRLANAALRGLSALSFGVSSLIAGLNLKKPDIILSFSPPIFMGITARQLAKSWHIRLVLNVKDLFTNAILAGGLAKPGLVTRLLYLWENKLYRKADRIVTNASNFRQYFEQQGVSPERIIEIPDWADGDLIRPAEKSNHFRDAWGLNGHFVVVYSGNMGLFSDLETVIEAAHQLSENETVRFVLVGDGVKKQALVDMVQKKGLTNVIFHPRQDLERLPEVLAASDIAMVTLSSEGGAVSTQGKLYSIMAAGRPVLALSPVGHDIQRIVQDNTIGWWVETGSAERLAQLVYQIKTQQDELADAGRHARQLFEEKYSLEVCARQFERVLTDVLEQTSESSGDLIEP